MIGLSGGGWTTTVYAAIDPRIVKSIPVAGTLPLYLRGDHYNHDLEQYVPAHHKRVECYAKAAAYLDPPAERHEVPLRHFRMPAYLRVPAGVALALKRLCVPVEPVIESATLAEAVPPAVSAIE